MAQMSKPSFFDGLEAGEEYEITYQKKFIRLRTGETRELRGQGAKSFSVKLFSGIRSTIEILNEALALQGFKLVWDRQYSEPNDEPRDPANARPFSPEFGHKSFLPHRLSTSLILRIERLPSP